MSKRIRKTETGLRTGTKIVWATKKVSDYELTGFKAGDLLMPTDKNPLHKLPLVFLGCDWIPHIIIGNSGRVGKFIPLY